MDHDYEIRSQNPPELSHLACPLHSYKQHTCCTFNSVAVIKNPDQKQCRVEKGFSLILDYSTWLWGSQQEFQIVTSPPLSRVDRNECIHARLLVLSLIAPL